MNKLSVQLYSIRDYTEKDFIGTLQRVSDMGYTGVEFAGYRDIPAAEMKRALDIMGLNAVSAHVSIDSLQNNLDFEMDYLLTLGAKNITCPYSDMDTKEKALSVAEILSDVADKTSKAGLTLSYHNHAHEFQLDNGEYPLDVFYANVDSALIKQEPDLFWVAYAGLDPIEYIKKHVDRCPLIHLKQIKNLESKENVMAQDGMIDFGLVAKLAPNAELIYEQEHFTGTSIEDVEKSAKYLLSL